MTYLIAFALLVGLSAHAQQPSEFSGLTPVPTLELQSQQALPAQSLDALLDMEETTQDESIEPQEVVEPSQIRSATLTKPEELERLMDLPAYNLQTSKAPLNDVISLLADACAMSYVGLEKGIGDDVLISVNINKNPYEILKYLAKRYGVALEYDDNIWHFGLYNDNELIARVYNLVYNNQESVSGGATGGSGGGDSEEGGSGATLDTEFDIDRDVLKNEISTFLELSSNNPDIMVADDFDVKNMTQLGERGIYRVRPEVGGATGEGSSSGKVIYNSDNKTLYVLATRQQHQWIEKYLTMVDKPQKQILVETKVYETGLNPESTLGFDWSGNVSSSRFQLNSSQLPSAQTDSDGAVTSSPADGISAFGGLTAIISAGDLTSTIRFLNSDSNTVSVQYPRQVTVSNRTVAIASVEKVPVKKASTETDTSTSSTGTSTSTEVEEIEVGTTITILPRIIDNDKIHMNIAVSVSSISGYKVIDGNEYPVVSERLYQTEAIVESGYTLAIGGLKETSQADTFSEVPVLSKLPVMGSLFKQRTKTATDRNLLIFISPYILKEYRGGVKDEPEFVVPHDKDYPERHIFKGEPEETYSDIQLSLAGLEYEVEKVAQRAREGHYTERLPSDVAFVENELKLMEVRLEEIALDQPNKDISDATKKIKEYHKDLNEIRRNISKHRPRY